MTLALVTTGGTIASVRAPDGASSPVLGAADVLAGAVARGEVAAADLRVVDLLAKDSSALTLADMQRISDAVAEQLGTPGTRGVVVLHGTDSLEETALLLHLQLRPAAPVVLTGAMRTADSPDSDGPANLAAALAEVTVGRPGVRVAFGGRLFEAPGLTKRSADAPDAFASEAVGALPHLAARVDGVRVDVVAVHPGVDATHLDASLAAGAHGVVLAGLGAGNATAEVVAGVRRCRDAGVPVVVSSRVPEGVLTPSYGGGGGGHDLAAAGAVHARVLRPGQARILLAALVASGADDASVRAAFAA
ncbi:asparaginase domain-containing protein [Nocardioides zeae]|uniref:asparaginase n=1 Tax=Nocardioides imazamoxiresistens TaxID=3231893 RepID=A0ABU3PVA7_9ACTN|nr:asparaginase domain-containing protein [Nocardioides zeae]MDT9593158.1 asparaginase domain-containing protein [Nocardioides zeae]